MEQEIENILLNSSLTDGEVSRLTNELLNLFSVSVLFDEAIKQKYNEVHNTGFETYEELAKAQDELRSLNIAKRVLNER